jgi:signal transduction histidine kinase
MSVRLDGEGFHKGMSKMMEKWRSRWTTALVVFSVFTLKLFLLLPQVYFYNVRSPEPLPWNQLLAKLALGTYTWAALVPPILFVSRRWKVERRNLPQRLLLHFGLGILFAAAQTTLYHFGLLLVGDAPDSFKEVPRLAGPWSFVFNGVLAYASIVAIHQAVLHFREAQERELRLQQSQMQLLKMQLQPHFLFNTLNTAAQLIYENREAAEKVLIGLGDLLRLGLTRMDEQEVTLARELEFVGKYLDVMQARFDGRLVFKLGIDPRALGAYVPVMILQPLVENSIRHGLKPRESGGHVEITAARAGGALHLCVVDNGCGIEEGGDADGAASAGHVGLANTRARLGYLYGDRHSFELTSVPGRGVRIRMVLPFRESPAGRDGAAPRT